MARPKEFDPEKALAAVKDAFWRHGYDGVSLRDLEIAAGLNKQSLYRAFGDKRGMYLRALADYDAVEIDAAARMLAEEGTAAARIERYFTHIVDAAMRTGDRRGCFLCNASVDQAPLDARTEALVGRMRLRVRRLYEDALAASPPYDGDRALLERKAAAVMASHLGLRVLIKAGAPETELRAIVADLVAGVERGDDRADAPRVGARRGS